MIQDSTAVTPLKNVTALADVNATESLQHQPFLDKQSLDLQEIQTVQQPFSQDEEDITTPFVSSRNVPALTTHFVFIKVKNEFRKIFLHQIDYIFYADRYSNLVIAGKLYPLSMTMKDLAKCLSTQGFVQIHQSYIVNINTIERINFYQNSLEIEGRTLPIGVSFKKILQMQLPFLT